MNERLDDLFEQLEPPPGGVVRLRSRLKRERRRQQHLHRGAAAACLALLVLALPLLWTLAGPSPRPAVDLTAANHPSLVRLGLAPAPSEPLEIPPSRRHLMAAQRVPMESERVVFYLVASALPGDPVNAAATD